MRWGKPKAILHKAGAIRGMTKFLFWPKTIWNPFTERKETRWLEWATWEEDYFAAEFPKWLHWLATKWVNK